MRKERLRSLIIARFFLWLLALTIACSNTVQANAQNVLDKKVNLNIDQVEVKKVLREIQRQTGVSFIYSSDIINLNKKVNCRLVNKKLAELFSNVLTPIGILFSVIDEKQILLYNAPSVQKKTTEQVSYESPAPVITVTGQVLNASALPLPGVSVMVRGASTGTVTDREGRFSLNVPYAEATLVFSFIGYQSQEVALQGRSTLAITLKEDAQNLKDVVVVGYGTQKKVTVTGAVAAISSKELQQSPTANLTNALAGRLPGLNVNQFAGGEPGVDVSDLYIRGIGTYGNARPIVIVDGVERSLNYLSADEIETFTILKDASATAVFGVRGANGVIVITTKRGKASEKASLNFKV